MATIVTYDVPTKHTELKKILLELGYKDQIPGVQNCKIIYLPNTTFYHSSKTALQAREDVQAVCKKLQVNLERCIATQWGPDWAAICGEDFK